MNARLWCSSNCNECTTVVQVREAMLAMLAAQGISQQPICTDSGHRAALGGPPQLKIGGDVAGSSSGGQTGGGGAVGRL